MNIMALVTAILASVAFGVWQHSLVAGFTLFVVLVHLDIAARLRM